MHFVRTEDGGAPKQFIHHADRIEHPMKRVGTRGTCNSATAIAWKLICGSSVFQPDAAHSKTHVVWPNNPGGGNDEIRALTGLRKNGVKLIAVNPHVTASANAADLHLQP